MQDRNEKLYCVSIALWPSAPEGAKLTASIHATLWRIPVGGRKHENFVDIYLSVGTDVSCDEITLYVPDGLGGVTRNHTHIPPSDVDYRIVSQLLGIYPGDIQQELTNGIGRIFPESSLHYGDIGSCVNVFMPSNDVISIEYNRHIHSLTREEKKDKSEEINYINKFSGEKIKINIRNVVNTYKEHRNKFLEQTISENPDVVAIGFRFKLPDATENPFMHFHKPQDQALLSGFEVIDFVDFRINDRAALPDEIGRHVTKAFSSHDTGFIQLHLNYCCHILYKLDYSSPSSTSSRLLERRYWSDYLQEDINPADVYDKTYVYSWENCPEQSKKSKYVKRISARLSARISDRIVISKYVAAFTIFSAVSSAFGGVIFAALLQQNTILDAFYFWTDPKWNTNNALIVTLTTLASSLIFWMLIWASKKYFGLSRGRQLFKKLWKHIKNYKPFSKSAGERK